VLDAMLTMRPHLALFHAGRKGGAHEKYAVRIDCLHPPPVGKRDFIERLIGKNAGAINEDVAAAEAFGDLIRKCLDRDLRGHITFAGKRVAASLLDHLHRIARRSDIGDDNVRPVLRKPLRTRLSDAVRSARDNCNFVVVGFGHAASLLVK
jgi:hypothetical protein